MEMRELGCELCPWPPLQSEVQGALEGVCADQRGRRAVG